MTLFPDNGEQNTDVDGDGFGDNSTGMMGDKFTEDPTQWNDTDNDGYGDNPRVTRRMHVQTQQDFRT